MTGVPATVRRGVAGVAACVAVALTVAACGSSSPSSSGAPANDPASLVPASALGYLAADLRPSGSLLQGIDAASQRLLGISDPGTQLDALIDKALHGGLSYEKNVRPWLGEQGAVAAFPVGTNGSSYGYAFVVDQTNSALATAAIDNRSLFLTGSLVKSGSYRGVSYVDAPSQQLVAGVVGHYAVLASSAAAFDDVVDVDKGAASLATVSGYKQALSTELPGADGVAYVPLLRAIDAIVASTNKASLPLGGLATGSTGTFQKLAAKYANAILSGSARFNSSGAALDITISGASSKTSSSSEINPIGALPGGSWLAVGATNVGPSLAALVTELGALGGATGLGGLTSSLSGIQSATGVNVAGDLRSITTAAFFAKGSNLATLEAGLVLGTTYSSKAITIVTQLKELLTVVSASDHAFKVGSLNQSNIQAGFTIRVPGVPFTFDVASAGTRIVIALGATSLDDALASTGRLDSTSTYTTAASLLGSGIQPDIIVELPDVGELLQNLGVSDTASATKVLTAIERLGTVALGTGSIGGEQHVRLIISGT